MILFASFEEIFGYNSETERINYQCITSKVIINKVPSQMDGIFFSTVATKQTELCTTDHIVSIIQK